MTSKIEQIQSQLDSLGIEPVIWLETHVTITSTDSKLFCSCKNQEWALPNTCICPICTWQMGVLPLLNKQVVKEAVKLALAIKSEVPEVISFDRKHYYYPDLPKWFQITQYEHPVAIGGTVDCYREDKTSFAVHLDHFHIEEDPAKLTHTKTGTLIDYNRSGKPLLEIVTQPDIYSISDALSYMNALHKLVRALKISDGDMEKWQFKSDISISLRRKWDTGLNPRTEIKNMNSFKFAQEAILQEIESQLKYRTEKWEFKKDQLTVRWDESKWKLEVMRKKENVSDYRIMPEPDIPFISLKGIEQEIELSREILPFEIEKNLIQNTNLTFKEIQYFSENIQRAKLLFAVNVQIDDLQYLAKLFLNAFTDEVYGKLSATDIVEIIQEMQKRGNRSSTVLKSIVQQLVSGSSFDWRNYLDQSVISAEKLVETVEKVLWDPSNQKVLDDIKSGNAGAIGALVGKVKEILWNLADWSQIKQSILERLEWKLTSISTTKEVSKKYSNHLEAHVNNFSLNDFYFSDSYRSHKLKDLDESFCGQEVMLAWWIQSIRDHGDLLFIDLREDGEVFQVKISKDSFWDMDQLSWLTCESVISCKWVIIERNADDINEKLRTWTIELNCQKLYLLSRSNLLPFEILTSHKVNEAKRMKYRFLDLRNNKIRENIFKRHEIIKIMRNSLNNKGFIEVETPIMGKASDEWSREFIVPSRLYPGQFYVLPQAPQQLKQLLMGSGVDKYYQLARCFRDEDPKWDRQPEFTQLDMELAFTNKEEIISIISELLLKITRELYPNMKIQNTNFPKIDYANAMEFYGCDKPDIRYGLKMRTITDVLQDTEFSIFKQVIDNWGIVKALIVEKDVADRFAKKYLDEKLRSFSIEWWLWWLANIRIWEQNFITDKLGDAILNNIIQKTWAQKWDILLFGAGVEKVVNKALDAVRQKIATDFSLYDDNELAFCWVVNFPMFEKTDEWNWKFTHNPFSMPQKEFIPDLLEQRNVENILAEQYDIVLNGNEIGGGSIRAHIPEILEGTYKVMWYSDEEMQKSVGHMLDAFRYWFPPHGGIALWVDRLVMILQQKKTIREVIAFPKTWDGKDLMMNSPSFISEEKKKEANIRSI